MRDGTTHPRKSKIKYVLLALLALLVLVPVAGYIALKSMDVDRLASYLQQVVRENTGRELYIKGGVEVTFGLTPSLSLYQVALANPPWAKRDALFYADRLSVSLNVLPLLQREIDIRGISADGAKLALEKSAGGKVSWLFDAPSKKSAPGKGALASFSEETEKEADAQTAHKPPFTIYWGPVTLHNTEVTYDDHANDAPLLVTIPELTAQTQKATRLEASVKLQSFSGNVTLEGAALKELPEKPILVDVALQGEQDARMSLKGKIKNIAAQTELYLTLDAGAQSLAAFSALTGGALPETDALSLATEIAGSPKELALDQLRAQVGETEASGRARVSLNGAKPFVSATLNIPSYRVNKGDRPADDAAAGAPEHAPSVPKDKRILPDIAFPGNALSAVSADVEFTVGEIVTPKRTLNSVMGHLVLKEGILQADPLQFKLGEDLVKGDFAYNTSVSPAAMRLKFSAQGNDLGAFLKAVGATEKMEGGRFSGEVALKGVGGGLYAMLPQLQGTAELVVENAVIKDPKLQEATELANMIQGKNRSGDVGLTCALGKLSINQGVGTPDYLVADTKHTRLYGEGTFDLPQELLALTFYPQPKEAGLSELSFPVKIKGSFADPQIKPDRAQAALSVAKLFSGSKKLRGLESLLGKGKGGAPEEKDMSGLHPCLEPISLPPDASDVTAKDVVGEKKEDVKQEIKSIEKDVRGLRDGLKNLLKH